MDRRCFLRLAAGAAAAAAVPACGSGSKASGSRSAKGRRTLRIAQTTHFVPAYDDWFDNQYTKRWGEEHDVDVVVDHVPYAQSLSRADAEVRAERGHDLFAFIVPAARFADEAIDHADVVSEIERKAGPMLSHVERSVRNPKTGRYRGVADFWFPQLTQWRTDLWASSGHTPETWDEVVRAAPVLKAGGHPLGIQISDDFDSTQALTTLLFSYGASIQDEDGRVALGNPATIEAVKVGVELFRQGMTDEVFLWDNASDNRFLASGQGSLTIDPVSAVRAIEQQDPPLAAQVALARPPAGPAGAKAPQYSQTYAIWRFVDERELAQQFLVDLASDYRQAFIESRFYNCPAFPEAVPDLASLVASDSSAQPQDKYALLAEGTTWTTNIGHPGSDNPAIDEVVNSFLIPRMFAAAAKGEMTPEEAVAAAAAQAEPIFAKWRKAGKI